MTEELDPQTVLDALKKLDGTVESAVMLLTGASREELERLGGLSNGSAQRYENGLSYKRLERVQRNRLASLVKARAREANDLAERACRNNMDFESTKQFARREALFEAADIILNGDIDE